MGHEHLGALNEVGDHGSEGELTATQHPQAIVGPDGKSTSDYIQPPRRIA